MCVCVCVFCSKTNCDYTVYDETITKLAKRDVIGLFEEIEPNGRRRRNKKKVHFTSKKCYFFHSLPKSTYFAHFSPFSIVKKKRSYHWIKKMNS